jgi:bile acid-coenzyme A ligase
MDRSFGEVLQGHASGARADEIAVSYPGAQLSWKQLDARSRTRAKRLVSLGVSPNDLVAVALVNGIEHHVNSFAAWRAGATTCVLPTRLPGSELQQILEIARPAILVSESGESLAGIGQIAPAGDLAEIDNDAPLQRELAADHWKAVTSGGSTGRPKLIVDHVEARLGARLEALIDLVQLPRGGVMLNPGPLYHNAPFLFTSLALLAGTRVIGMQRFDAEEALRLIERERIEWICMVPTMMHRIWSLPEEVRNRYDVSSLRRVVHMAAACPAWLKQAWIDWLGPDRILEIYAGTEGSAIFITGDEWLRKPGSVGRASLGGLTVRDEEGGECAAGVVGEIYFPAEAATRFHYIGAVTALDSKGRMSLGDMGHVDEDGYLFLSDRRSDLIIRGGANIYSAEVEGVLSQHGEVSDVVVIGLPCDDLGQRVHAVVHADQGVSVSELDAFARKRLSGYKCPESYEFVTEPLRDEAGKVRRSELRSQRSQWMKNGVSFRHMLPARKSSLAGPF